VLKPLSTKIGKRDYLGRLDLTEPPILVSAS
jgi:hypothetical protein